MIKPILVIKTKQRFSQAQYEDAICKISKLVQNEYHILIMPGPNDIADIEVINIIDATETDIKELREKVIDSMKNLIS